MARPTDYNQDIADKICDLIVEGNSLKSICTQNEDMPNISTVFRWVAKHAEFRDKYERAIEERTYALGEELLEIADDGSNDFMTITKGDKEYNVEDREVTNRSKLRVETRKWLMSKMKPKKYGDKLDLTSGGEKLPTPIYGGSSTKDA